MQRICDTATFPVVLIALVLAVAPATFGQSTSTAVIPPVPRLLPGDTLAFLNIRDTNDLREDLSKSSMSKMLNDPQMRPFVSDFYSTAETLINDVAQSVGVTLDELLAIPQGQFAIALLPGVVADQTDSDEKTTSTELTDQQIARRLRQKREQANSFAVVVIIDAGDQSDAMSGLLDRLAGVLLDGGAIESTDTPSGVRRFVRSRGEDNDGSNQVLEWFRRDSVFVIGNDRDTAASIRLLMEQFDQDGEKASSVAAASTRAEEIADLGSLAENPSFSAVISRSLGAEMEEPGVTFFVDPANLVKRLIRRSGNSFFIMPIVQDLGLSKIRGVGGGLFRGDETVEGISHLHVVIDPPRDGFFGVLRPEPVSMKPPQWVPTEVSSYNSFSWDFETAFNNLGKIVNKFAGEGRFEDFIPRQVETRLDLDIREDFLSKITGRYVTLRRYEQPVSWNSIARVDAFEFEDAADATFILDHLKRKFPGDEFKPTTISGTTVYQLGTPRAGRPGFREVTRQLWQTGNWLIFSDSAAFAQAVIRTQGGTGDRLVDDEDYLLMASEIDAGLEGDDPFFLSFRRDDEQLRFVYDLLGSEGVQNRLSRGGDENRVGNQFAGVFERNSLPDFDVLAKYFFLSGFYAVDEPGGIHFAAITLRAF